MREDVLFKVKPLIVILKFYGKNVNVEALQHKYNLNNKEEFTIKDYKIICKDFHIKVQLFKIKIKKLKNLSTPFIYKKNDETLHIVVKIKDNNIICLDLNEEKPRVLSYEEFVEEWSNEVILFKKKRRLDDESDFGFQWFFHVILKFKSALIQVLLAYFFIQIISLCTPIFIQFTLDQVLSTSNISTLKVLSILMLFALLIEYILNLSKDYIFHFTTNRIDMILNSKIIQHLFALPLGYFEKRRVGDTVARVREVENIRSFLTGTPLMAILDVLFVFIYIIMIFIYSKTLSFIILSIIPIIIIIYAFVTPIFKKRLDQKYYDGAELQSFIVESMNGIHTIKSFALEPKMKEKWEDVAADYINTSFKTKKLSFITNDLISFLQKLQDVVVVAMGITLIIEQKLTVGELVAFRMISSKITSPLLRFVQLWQDYQQTSLSVKRVNDIFMNPKEFADDDFSSMELPNIKGNIKFENINFRYNVQQPLVLNNLSFEIKPNQIIGVIGRSGSGKSTLSKLIQRLYIPESGKIYIDDIDTSVVSPDWLRRQIGIVLQENFIFNGTVKDNIALSDSSVSYERIEQVAKISGAHEFIIKLEKGYNTLIGEKGVGLSGGQKQRLAIARALIQNPKILIFDEATSALDYESERIIQNNLKNICRNRTVIIIAHRLSTIKDCDMIMSIDNGKIIEFNKPEILLQNKNSFYRYLMRQQEGVHYVR